MAYIFADVTHEAIGHGFTSLILGYKITLLTSVYFRSETHSFITDACGPLLNLLAGLTIWAVLKHINFSNFYVKLLLVLTMAFNFFWFSWMCIYSGVTNKGDLAFYISGEKELFIWRLFLIILGFLAYFGTFQMIEKTIRFKSLAGIMNIKQLFFIPYLAAGIFALLAVSFYRPLSFDNFYEAFVFPMFLPTIFLGRQTKISNGIGKEYSFGQQKLILLSGLGLIIIFCLTMGTGI